MEFLDNVDLRKIKLIIWDLDETFWKGIISENSQCEIELSECNINFIKTLVHKGIMNSICSKNDFETIKNYFLNTKLNNIWEYFVFKSINWEPKGQRIKTIIEKMQLRDENVLFIDDNIMNLKEASFYCPNIKTLLPDKIEHLIQQTDLIEKDDSKLSRLKQYKILEEKDYIKNEYSSNEDFLYHSNIRLEICDNCQEEKNRLVELINRTNQLNYTKIRIDEAGFDDLLNNSELENRYVKVKDNFGDYGIVGFYSLNIKTNKLIHFLFSCRTMGMGIEQYVYAQLNFPDLNVIGDVANKLEAEKFISWINQEGENIAQTHKHVYSYIPKILFKGPCDLSNVLSYLNFNTQNITIEQNDVDERGVLSIARQCSLIVANCATLSEQEIENICAEAPFICKQDFDQSIYKNNYDIVIYSLLIDDIIGIYEHIKTKNKIAFGRYFSPFTDKNNFEKYIKDKPERFNWTKENLEKYSKEYKFLGSLSPTEIVNNLKIMINNTAKNTKWIFVLGSEIDPEDNSSLDLHIRHAEINRAVENFSKNFKNIKCINITNFIKNKNDYTDYINHFQREIYYSLGVEIAQLINEFMKNKTIKIKNPKLVSFKRNMKNLCKQIFSIGNYHTDSGYKLGKQITILGINFKINKKL